MKIKNSTYAMLYAKGRKPKERSENMVEFPETFGKHDGKSLSQSHLL